MNRSLSAALIALAAITGFFTRGWVEPGLSEWIGLTEHHDDHDDHPDDHADPAEEEPHVALSRQAFDTLRLRMGQVTLSDYLRTTAIPAEVAEFPGVSAYKLAAPVNGVVRAVAAEPGATAEPGDALFEVQITDERVLDAQLQLIEALTRAQIVEEELERLEPLAQSGVVNGRQRRDLGYELRELQTTIGLRRDELIVRGLPEDQVEELFGNRRLLRSVVVRAPQLSTGVALREESSPAVRTVAWEEQTAMQDLSIERLLVEPGQTVARGEALCDLASHSKLYLRVKAFERDVPLMARLAERGEPLTAEFGHSLESHRNTSSLVTDLRVRYVANHVDPGTQAYSCYVPLSNELLHESTGPQGRKYRTWRFSVGQRAHLLLPIEQIRGQIPLPADAVAIEGPNAFVFRPHVHEDDHEDSDHDDPHHPNAHPDHDDSDHGDNAHDELAHDDHEDAFIELEPVPVTVLYRDNQQVVVAVGGELSPGDTIAMNAAYQLHLAVEAHSGGGGGHDHHHDH
ncbi:efflux RND transporter periplasmic adaptor subunit [Botrimarina hoheduenensis]|nr:efflux RND transporter periplasmic adaptor subunit [Botrimarina hoheduenensis]